MTGSITRWIKKNKILLVNAGSLIGSTGVTSVLGFVYWWFAARQNSPEVVGFASAAISAMTLLGTVSMLGLGSLLIGELAQQKGKEASLISAALILVGGVGGCAGILYALLAPYLSRDFQPLGASVENVLLFAAGVSLTAVTLVLDQALIGLLRGEMQLWRNTLFTSVKLVALFAADLWLAHVTGLTLYATLVIGNLVSLAALGCFALVKRVAPARSYLPEWRLLKQLGTEALKHHALNLLLQAPSLILPVVVTIMLSPTVNAWFYVAWNLSSIANTVVASLSSTLYAISSAKTSLLVSKLRLTLTLAFVGCVLVNGILIVAPAQALELFGHTYAEQAAWSLRILAIESFPFIFKSHFIALARIRKQVGRTIFIIAATGALELGGSVVGAYLGGLNGLSLGWFLAMCVEAACMAPTVYNATRAAPALPQLALETDLLAGQAVWQQSTIKLPIITGSLGEEAAWLLDTLALTAIRPGVVDADTLHLQRIDTGMLRLAHIEKEYSPAGGERARLRPTRLERLSTREHQAVPARWEKNSGLDSQESRRRVEEHEI